MAGPEVWPGYHRLAGSPSMSGLWQVSDGARIVRPLMALGAIRIIAGRAAVTNTVSLYEDHSGVIEK
jgi:hypothetical protein